MPRKRLREGNLYVCVRGMEPKERSDWGSIPYPVAHTSPLNPPATTTFNVLNTHTTCSLLPGGSVDDVLGLMDDVEEGKATVDAISDALAQLGEGVAGEDEEVEEELRRMEEGMEERPNYDVKDLPDVPVSMPVAPQGGLPKGKEKERVAVAA